MTSEFPGIKLVSVDQYGGPTRETAFTVAQNLFNRFGPRIGGIFAPDEATACGTLLALREQGQLGRVHFVAFDANDQLVGALRAGELEGLVVQDPFGIGYAGVKTAVAVLRHEKVPAVIETHSVLVTRETMDEAESVALLHPPLQEFRN
jgi:ribose transport system substrate-binding protein